MVAMSPGCKPRIGELDTIVKKFHYDYDYDYYFLCIARWTQNGL